MNDPQNETRSPSAPDVPARRLIRWLYCNNPFYVISAALVFFGLRASFDPNGKVFEVWVLLLGMAGYTLLLAGTACLLIRLGDVWDDMRTLMLLVVLMFLSISVIFDDTMTCRPELGRVCYLGGLLFAVVVSEALMRGVRLRLPALFRVPYYLFLSLFFLFPVALGPLLTNPNNPMAVSNPVLPWALFAFPVAAGAITLTLVPAARRGPLYVDGNGSPWRWPLYPWSLFVVLAVGVCARAYYACISLHPVERYGLVEHHIFGPYFLVPFLFAVAVLLLEIGLAGSRRGAVKLALFAPAGLVALAALGHRSDAVYWNFVSSFLSVFGGSPLFLTLVAAVVFYGYAKLRGVPGALNGIAVCLAALSVIGPHTFDPGGLTAPRPLPFVLLGALELAIALRRQSSGRAMLAAACLVVATTFALGDGWSGPATAALAVHFMVAAALVIGAVYNDALAQLLRNGAILVLLAISVVVMLGEPRAVNEFPVEIRLAYPLLVALVTAGYGHLRRDEFAYAIAALNVAGWLCALSGRTYVMLRHMVTGLDQIALGLASFVLAALISLGKTGAIQKWRARRKAKACAPEP